MTLGYKLGIANSTDPTVASVLHNTPGTSVPYDYFGGSNFTQYVSQQWYSDGDSPIGAFYSNRSIYATSSCQTYPVIQGANGSQSTIGYDDSTGNFVTRAFELIEPLSKTLRQPHLGMRTTLLERLRFRKQRRQRLLPRVPNNHQQCHERL